MQIRRDHIHPNLDRGDRSNDSKGHLRDMQTPDFQPFAPQTIDSHTYPIDVPLYQQHVSDTHTHNYSPDNLSQMSGQDYDYNSMHFTSHPHYTSPHPQNDPANFASLMSSPQRITQKSQRSSTPLPTQLQRNTVPTQQQRSSPLLLNQPRTGHIPVPNPPHPTPNLLNSPFPINTPGPVGVPLTPQPSPPPKGTQFVHDSAPPPQGRSPNLQHIPNQSPVTQIFVNSVVDAVSSNPLLSIQSSFPSWILMLKHYFNISHTYVFYRVCFLFCPYYHIITVSKATALSGPNYYPVDSSSLTTFPSQPSSSHMNNTQDYFNTVDFYIPLMAFITYILLFGMTKGTSGEFRPDLLGRQATIAVSLVIFEVIVIKTVFYITGPTSIPSLNLVAFSGYKFVQLVMIVSTGLILKFISEQKSHSKGFTNITFWFIFIYFTTACAAELSFFLILHHKNLTQQNNIYDQPNKNNSQKYLSVLFALVQFPICWFLTPYFSF